MSDLEVRWRGDFANEEVHPVRAEAFGTGDLDPSEWDWVAQVERYSLEDRRRLSVRPGLTCLWQVQGRGDIPFPEQVRLDVEYIENRGFWMDVRLLLQTVPAVLLGRGAY